MLTTTRRRPVPAPPRPRVVLLTAAQERDLAARVAAGGPDGVTARNALVEANLPYALLLARRWAASGRDLDDVLSLAHLGLIRAAGKFDPSRGRFTTCAHCWIRQAVLRGLKNEGSLIRVPVHLHDLRRRVARGAVDPAALPPGRARLLAAVDRALAARPGPRPDGREDDPLAGLPAAPAGGRPDVAEDLARLGALLGALPAQERAVLVVRFGLDGDPPRTLKAAGRELGLSSQWAHKLEARGLARLRDLMADGGRPGRGVE